MAKKRFTLEQTYLQEMILIYMVGSKYNNITGRPAFRR
jgi:hypothetical protein